MYSPWGMAGAASRGKPRMPCAQVTRSSKIFLNGTVGSGPTSRAAALRPGQTNRGGCREQQCFRRIMAQRIGFGARLETVAEGR